MAHNTRTFQSYFNTIALTHIMVTCKYVLNCTNEIKRSAYKVCDPIVVGTFNSTNNFLTLECLRIVQSIYEV